ncbi:Zona occludens toxin [Thalassocella blandensis]|nr:Zona occludens toxin [Thalassocella blandensis]
MTIAAYVGLPGHGKSYGVVANVIVKALEKKRQVFTNIPMNDEECLKRFQMSVTPFNIQDIIDNPDWWSQVFTPGAILVIDELWRLWPSGLNAKNVRQQDKEFLAEHRHLVGENGLSTEIYFVTQDLSQIANFARSLVENTFQTNKLSSLGMNKQYRVDVFYGPVTGVTPPASKREREIIGTFKKEVYTLYKSHTKSMTGDAGDETRTDNRFNVWGRTSIKLGIIAFVTCALFVVFAFSRVFAYYSNAGESDATTSANKSVQAVHQPVKIQQTQVTSKQKKKKPDFEFLSKAQGIYISFNNGHWPRIDYRFKVVFNDMQANFTSMQLASMDYSLNPINECMVKIKGPDYNGFAMCMRDEPQEGFIESIVAGGRETTDM